MGVCLASCDQVAECDHIQPSLAGSKEHLASCLKRAAGYPWRQLSRRNEWRRFDEPHPPVGRANSPASASKDLPAPLQVCQQEAVLVRTKTADLVSSFVNDPAEKLTGAAYFCCICQIINDNMDNMDYIA
jgi:hypothetical protein